VYHKQPLGTKMTILKSCNNMLALHARYIIYEPQNLEDRKIFIFCILYLYHIIYAAEFDDNMKLLLMAFLSLLMLSSPQRITRSPTASPTAVPTQPTPHPTSLPTQPTAQPTPVPTQPTFTPTPRPTLLPPRRLDRDQYEALKLLYDSTNGSHWRWRQSGAVWDFTSNSDPCIDSWQGLTCSRMQLPVVLNSISLGGYNLSGSLPTMLFQNFTSLQIINLIENQLTGMLPSSLYLLSNLRLLVLERNLLSGTLSTAIGNLSSLQGLNLRFNDFSGTIPTTFGLLTNLGSSDGNISIIVPLGGIAISYSRITGTVPTELCNLFQMKTLFLVHTLLTGTIPSEIGKLKGLQNLHLSGNRMTGSLPPSIGQLVNLRSIFLFENKLTGSIPDSFVNLTNLMVLLVQHNYLNSSLPSMLGNLGRLIYVQLYSNQLTGKLPDLSRLNNINVFDVALNSFTGTIPSYIGNNWTRLTRFTLSSKGSN